MIIRLTRKFGPNYPEILIIEKGDELLPSSPALTKNRRDLTT